VPAHLPGRWAAQLAGATVRQWCRTGAVVQPGV